MQKQFSVVILIVFTDAGQLNNFEIIDHQDGIKYAHYKGGSYTKLSLSFNIENHTSFTVTTAPPPPTPPYPMIIPSKSIRIVNHHTKQDNPTLHNY